MDEILEAVLRGMTFGSTYSLLAVGLVLTYKTAGIFNLAFGAQAFVSGAVYYEARVRHDLPIPVAFVLAVLMAAPLLGLLLDRLLFRHLRTAPPIARLVTTLGLLVAIPEITKLVFDPSTTPNAVGIVPNGSTPYNPFGNVFMSRDDIATIVVTLVVVGALMGMFRYSSLGLRMRAVVESSRMTELAGVNADRVSMTAAVLSSILAGLAGVLISPALPQINDLRYTPLVVAAISAAVLASLSSIPLAFVGGLLLGITSQVLSTQLPTDSVLATNLRPSLPFVALFLVLIFSPRLRNRREAADPLSGVDPPPPALVSTERSDSLTWMTRSFGVVSGGLFLYWLFFHANGIWILRSQAAVIYAIIFLSITVITGMGGLISLCQATFAGIGALATAQLATDLGMGVLFAAIVAGVIAAAVGAMVALPALRLGGIFLSLATFAFALFFDNVMVKYTWVSGGNGITAHDTPRPTLGNIDFANEKSFLVLCIVALAITATAVLFVRNGTTGRYLDALRGSETAAAAMGINANRARIIAFALSAGIAGFGGGLFSMQQEQASYLSLYKAELGLVWIVVVVSLGARTVEGAIQAAAGFVFFQSVVLATWIPWLLNKIGDVAPGFDINVDSVPSGLAVVFFGLGALTYARHPEGVLEFNKRKSLAFTQRQIDRFKRAPAGDEGSPPRGARPQPVPATTGGDS